MVVFVSVPHLHSMAAERLQLHWLNQFEINIAIFPVRWEHTKLLEHQISGFFIESFSEILKFEIWHFSQRTLFELPYKKGVVQGHDFLRADNRFICLTITNNCLLFNSTPKNGFKNPVLYNSLHIFHPNFRNKQINIQKMWFHIFKVCSKR